MRGALFAGTGQRLLRGARAQRHRAHVGQPDAGLVDATPSTGDIVEYAWRVELSGGLFWTHTSTTPVPPVRCIRTGSHRVELRTRVRSYRGHTNRVERVITVGPLPCEARITSTVASAATTCVYDFAAATPHRRCTRADGVHRHT